MPSAQKDTKPAKGRSPRKVTTRAQRDPLAVALGERLASAATARGLTQYALARAIGQRWGDTVPTTRIGHYFHGMKSPNARALCDLCDVLGVSADWLLNGNGPMWREGQRPPNDWEEDLAAYVQRHLCERLKDRTADDGRFRELLPEHLTVNARALLDQTTADLTTALHREADRILDAALKARASERQAEVITALTAALPQDATNRHEAGAAAWTLAMEASHMVPESRLTVGLTEAGVDVLLKQWEWPEATDAAQTLQRIASAAAVLAALDAPDR